MTFSNFKTYFKLLIHVLVGCFLIFIIFMSSLRNKNRIIQWWSLRLLKILRIYINFTNFNFSKNSEQNYFFVSNHISWTDIFVINAIYPVIFLAKSSVKQWPIFGLMASVCNTVFIDRNSKKSLTNSLGKLNYLIGFNSICIFPEGTSTIGHSVSKFHSNYFQIAIDNQFLISPLSLKYIKDGKNCNKAAFIDDDTLLQSIKQIVGCRGINVEVKFLSKIDSKGLDRKELAFKAYESISKSLRTY